MLPACAGPTRPPPTVEQPTDSIEAFAATARKLDTIECPEGAILKGTPPPDGDYAWCELPSGETHWPWMVWPSRGTPRKIATYRNGKLNGTWQQWHTGVDTLARIEEYVDGERHGRSV